LTIPHDFAILPQNIHSWGAMEGKVISHYRILEKLGEGGMGVVYKAEDTKLKRIVALKFLPPLLSADDEVKQRFIHEAQAASTLNHPNICSIHTIEEFEKQQFIDMEFVEGKTLGVFLKEKELSLREVVNIALQIAEGLNAAQKKGIVHRDIKPDNIMVTDENIVKITDFGLAKLRGSSKFTKTHSTLGTLSYMSPEQARGEEVDQRTDIFSLGAVLYEMVTGRRPFKGEHEAAIIYSLVNEAPEPLARYKSNTPDELQRVVDKALAKERDKRYQHVDDMVADLRRIRQETSGITVSAKKKSNVLWMIAAAIVVFVIVGIYLFYPKSVPMSAISKSVAVLPFKNLSDSKEDEYFSDGITDDIIAQLSKITDLKVISRTSVMQYKGISKNIREIGRELDVATVLEGSVRRSGNQIRIVAQLIDANNEGHLWADTYDKEMTQVFAIQSDVAQRIAAALKAKLSLGEKERINKSPTQNLTAYDYYLRGREYYSRYSRADNEAAISLFKKALALDSAYALAYAGLGDAYGQRVGRFGYSPVWSDSAIVLSEKAILNDPKLAEGFKALGLAYGLKGWLNQGLDAYHKALEINPNYSPALGNIGLIELRRGNLAECVTLLRKDFSMNPRNPGNYVTLAYAYFMLDDDTKARELLRKALDLQPNIINGHLGLSMISVVSKQFREATEQCERALAVDPNDFTALNIAGDIQLFSGNLGRAKGYYESALAIDTLAVTLLAYHSPLVGVAYILWETGHRDEAHRIFNKIIERHTEDLARGNKLFTIPYELACINAIEGNKVHAYQWLDKAIDAGWRLHRFGVMDPFLENLRNEDRFKRTMERVKGMTGEQRKRVDEMEKA